jgi:allantoinase
LRGRHQVEALWGRVLDGRVHNIGSDHSPATIAQKDLTAQEHGDVPDGITGVQTMLPLLLSEGVRKRGLSLERFVSLTSANAARTFGLYPRKGAIQVGSDADLAIADLDARWTLTPELLHYKCPWSPHTGWQISGRIVRTILRGQTVFRDGQVTATPGMGAFIAGPGAGHARQ